MLAALVFALSIAVQMPIPDQKVESVQYAYDSPKVILRNWVPPANLEYAPTNTTKLEFLVSDAIALESELPVRIGRAERM